MHKKFEGFPHVMISQPFSRRWLEEELFPLTDHMEDVFEQGGCDYLKGKRMVSFFYQPSTRTRASFEFAMDYLGGKVVFATDNAREFSSGAKGETLKHTLKNLNRYRPDIIILRYDREIAPEVGAKKELEIVEAISKISKVPIINAGDRNPGQHPSQAFLDVRTILKCRGQIDGLSIAMVGDLMKGRTVRSLCYLLGKFKGIKINFVSPAHARMKNDVKDYLNRHDIAFDESKDLRMVAPQVDAVYQTRTQTECGTEIDRNDHKLGYFTIDESIAESMKKDAIIMHPLPCNDEITEEVEDNPRAVYLTKQVDSGLLTRMALLKMILAPAA